MKFSFLHIFCAMIVCFASVSAFGESVFVLDHVNNLFCFDVVSDEMIYRDTLLAGFSGGVDLAVDNGSDILFRSCEFNNVIELIHAKDLEIIKSYEYGSIAATDMTGIVYDDYNSILLGTERNTNKLYIFDWEPSTLTLTLRPDAVQLAQIANACDLSLNGDILYVSEYSYSGAATYEEVYAYDMSNDFAFIEKIDMGDPVVAIDYNADGDSIYGGAWQGSGSQYLIKCCFDPDSLVKKELGVNVVGISANRNVAGRVFMTTLNNTLQLWDASGVDPDNFSLVDEYDNSNSDGVVFSGLAGLVVGDDYINSMIELDKYDDVNDCASPGEELTYTISWENLATETAGDAYVIDYLPDGVTYEGAFWALDPNMNMVPPDPGYHGDDHAYVWHVGDILANDSNSVSLTVTVNEKAEPGMTLLNKAVLTSSFGTDFVTLETDVCCWDTVDPNIIYVDKTATGNNNGTNWADAYTDMQRAIARATNSACQVGPYTIYAARGTYTPGVNINDTFDMPDGVSVYGGFASGGSDFADRNPDRYVTVLSGKISAFMNNDTVVTMGDETLLDGFTVTQAVEYGIYGRDVNFVLENCTITGNNKQGLYAKNGNVVTGWCNISNNTENGIHHTGAGYTLMLHNCHVVENSEYGIRLESSTPTIKNSVISGNGFTDEGFFGIYILLPGEVPVLYNNTLAYNANAGISWVDDVGGGVDPNVLDQPDIQNCILWYNNDGGGQVAGFDQDDCAWYCCIQDCNDVNSNINDEPGFAYEYSDDPNVLLNVHLAYDSPCIDMGSPYLSYADQNDIDAEARVVDSYVDIGADEVYSCDDDLTEDDIYNEVDWTADGIVNMHEYSIFLASWLSADPNSPLCDPNNMDYVSDPNDSGFISEEDKLRYSSRCDIDDDMDVDMADFALFCDEWLWMACWRDSVMYRYEMMMAMGGGESMMMTEPYAMESSTVDSGAIEGYQPPTLEQSAAAILAYVNWNIEQNHPNTEALYDMKAFLEDTLKELRKKK